MWYCTCIVWLLINNLKECFHGSLLYIYFYTYTIMWERKKQTKKNVCQTKMLDILGGILGAACGASVFHLKFSTLDTATVGLWTR